MKITLDIPEDLLKEAQRLSKSKTKTETVVKALRDYVRKLRVERVLSCAGKLQMTDDWDMIRHGR